MAQKPIIVKPTQIPSGQTQVPPGQVIKQGEAMKKAAENKAAIDKVLNAELVKVDLVIVNDKRMSPYMFKTRTFSLSDDFKKASFVFVSLEQFKPVITTGPDYDYKSTFTIGKTLGFLGGEKTYRELLTNGMTAEINFIRGVNTQKGEYTADFYIILYFSDGTRLEYPLQDFKVASKKGTWKSVADLKIVKKIAGSEIPDPAHPFVLPPVK
jgi:hypothetical protein